MAQNEEPECTGKLYSEQIDAGLDEYVKQDISSIATRDYDLGKFLFTVSTFAILVAFTIVSALGKEFFLILLSVFWFAKSVNTALELSTKTGYEIQINKQIFDDYQRKVSFIQDFRNRWYRDFKIGIIVASVLFALSSGIRIYFEFVEDKKQNVSHVLMSISANIQTLSARLEELRDNPECHSHLDTTQILDEIFENRQASHDNAKAAELHHKQTTLHMDRHLYLLANKIENYCNSSALDDSVD